MYKLLFWAAVLPPLFLMWKVYQMDKIEKEPIGLLVKLCILGAVACIPAGLIENALEEGLLKNLIAPSSILYAAIANFIIVAGAEEGLKYLVLKKLTWNNPAFDHRFDAVVYSVATTLGFAALENVLYVTGGGMSVALSRALLSIPGHCIFGIYMGYYYGMAKQYSLAGDVAGEKRFLRKAIFQPLLLHGFYDFCLSTGYDIFILVFFVYIIILDVKAYRRIKKLAAEDYRM
ncbi:MAG: PrsW family intramembrane metalloprotease [Eubacterium sp.]|nr:PrsW family intramembrane metalloprotease [Eubacterium sp.]